MNKEENTQEEEPSAFGETEGDSGQEPASTSRKRGELVPEDFFKAFYILLRYVGGAFSFPAKLLDEIPEDEELITTEYIEKTGRYVFRLKNMSRQLPRILRRNAKILTPPKSLIILNDG